MAAGALLQKFARKGVILEGRGKRLAAAAAAVLAVGGATLAPAVAGPGAALNVQAVERIIEAQYGRPMPDLPSMGILHAASYPKMRNFTRADDPGRPAGGMSKAEGAPGDARPATVNYGAMVRDIQAQVDREFPGRIHLVDRSKPVEAELSEIAGLTGKPLKTSETFIISGDPHTSPAFGPKATVCLVIGPHPELDAHGMSVGFAEEMLGSKIAFAVGADVTDETSHRFSLWHEVGHCLLGSSEAKADAFAVLKTVAESGKLNFLDGLIAVRELMERISTPIDDHIISPTLRKLSDRYAGGAVADDGSRSLRELAGTADQLPTPIEAATILLRNRLALTRFDEKTRGFNARAEFLVPVKEGFVATDFRGWIKASASIPEIARIGQLIDYLEADPATRGRLSPAVIDHTVSARAVRALARAGDPVAREIAPILGEAAPVVGLPLENEGLLAASQVDGRPITFDRSSAVVKFGRDLRSFLVRDAATNRPILAGNARDGITKAYDATHAPMRTADRDLLSPRF